MKRFERARAAASRRTCRGAYGASRRASRGKSEKVRKGLKRFEKVCKCLKRIERV